MNWSSLIPLISVLGGASKAGAENDLRQDQLRTLMEQTRLNRDKFALEAPGTRLATSTRASLTGNYQPSSIDWGGGASTFTPGFGLQGKTPTFHSSFEKGMSNLNPETKSLSDQVSHDMLVGQQRGGETGGGNNLPLPFVGSKADTYGTDKMMMPLGQDKGSGVGSKLLGGASTGLSVLQALLGLFGKGGGDPKAPYYDDATGQMIGAGFRTGGDGNPNHE